MAMRDGDDDRAASLPFNPTHPHDTLQYGLSSFKQEALPVHPLQALQATVSDPVCNPNFFFFADDSF